MAGGKGREGLGEWGRGEGGMGKGGEVGGIAPWLLGDKCPWIWSLC